MRKIVSGRPARPCAAAMQWRLVSVTYVALSFLTVAVHAIHNQQLHSGPDFLLQADRLGAIGAHEAAARVRRGPAFHRTLTEETERSHSMIQQWVDQQDQLGRATGTIPRFSSLPESEWDYRLHGEDWGGLCKTGMKQSPVDLHIEGLQEPEYRNLTSMYMNAFAGSALPYRAFKPWKRGDIFYTYPHQFTQVEIYKTDKVFQVRVPDDSMTTLGALFPTDTTEMYAAQHIFFHSPSEHTFQGEANRREIEMQIWHYSNDLLSFEASTSVNHTSLPYLALFAQSSLNLPDVEEALRRNTANGTDPNLPSSHWRVISLTFMSEELDQTSLAELRSLPSERLLSTLLSAETIKSQGKCFVCGESGESRRSANKQLGQLGLPSRPY